MATEKGRASREFDINCPVCGGATLDVEIAHDGEGDHGAYYDVWGLWCTNGCTIDPDDEWRIRGEIHGRVLGGE